MVACALFGFLSHRAVRACQEVSDRCADAGWIWQVLASMTLLGALVCLCAALIGAGWRALSRFGRWAPRLFVAGVLVFVATAFNNYRTLGLRSKHAEVRTLLAAMQRAQAAEFEQNGAYRAGARAPALAEHGAMEWASDPPLTSAWALPGWSSPQRTWCQYEVDLVAGDFIARALCDVDRDGGVAVYEARSKGSVRRVTAADLW